MVQPTNYGTAIFAERWDTLSMLLEKERKMRKKERKKKEKRKEKRKKEDIVILY